LIRRRPLRRGVNFYFNPKGGLGKSLTADYMVKNPEFNAMLVPQLESMDRWTAGLVDQLKQYKSLNGCFPTTLIVDLTRNADEKHVDRLYSKLENIKDGRIDTTFYGRFQRLEFPTPHVLVFTNNVPNLAGLSRNRFNLFVIGEEDHNFTLAKCRVDLRIEVLTRTLVTWSYKACISDDSDQRKFYEKILSDDMVSLAMSSLQTRDGHISTKEFQSDERTTTISNAPEPVKRLVNIMISKSRESRESKG